MTIKLLDQHMTKYLKTPMPSLPIPNPEDIHKSQQLIQKLFHKINLNRDGISFAEYMQDVLYTPNLGYYTSGILPFGYRGDFVTAPELSPLFSRCLARQCKQILEQINNGIGNGASNGESNGNILEIGAGSGQMAIDILMELERLNALPKKYYILELSTHLQNYQFEHFKTRCPELLSRVQWLSENSFKDFKFKGVIIGNELVDAMPVHKFSVTEQGLMETRVIAKKEMAGFFFKDFLIEKQFTKNDMSIFLEKNKALFSDLPIGYNSEINLNLDPWLRRLLNFLEQGVILLIDYGFPRAEFYHPDRTTGTLMCHYRHYSHMDPFCYPGLQDITAHVDFTTIAETAFDENCDVLGFTNQTSFLIGCGLLELVEQANLINGKENDVATKNTTENTIERYKQSQAIQILTSTAEMGELFKAIAIGKGFDEPLMGFQFSDQRYRLG